DAVHPRPVRQMEAPHRARTHALPAQERVVSAQADDFAWEDPPKAEPTDVYGTRWFTDRARQALTSRPGAWGRIARDAGNHVHVELRRRYPNYEFKGVRQRGEGVR